LPRPQAYFPDHKSHNFWNIGILELWNDGFEKKYEIKLFLTHQYSIISTFHGDSAETKAISDWTTKFNQAYSSKRRGKNMSKKILIVDDDPDLVEAVTMILESKNYDLAAAYGGIEGLQKAKAENPDLIVLDVMMPDKDGYAVCRELKADPKFSKIPILLLTAVVSKIATTRYTQQGGLETEADDYIDKPVEPDVLVKRIESLLAK
jgi:two-component system, OmpR family, alkaline phosphatase synthesis response regulator PhoP